MKNGTETNSETKETTIEATTPVNRAAEIRRAKTTKFSPELLKNRAQLLSEFNATIDLAIQDGEEIVEAEDEVIRMILRDRFNPETSPEDFWFCYGAGHGGVIVCRIGASAKVSEKLEQSILEKMHGKGQARNVSA